MRGGGKIGQSGIPLRRGIDAADTAGDELPGGGLFYGAFSPRLQPDTGRAAIAGSIFTHRFGTSPRISGTSRMLWKFLCLKFLKFLQQDAESEAELCFAP